MVPGMRRRCPGIRLGPYEVGLCSLLARYGEDDLRVADEGRAGELLLEEVSTAGSLTSRVPEDLHGRLRQKDGGEELWEAFLHGLRSIDTPDSLLDTFACLEGAISREPGSNAAVHAAGVLGLFGRRCLLSFKEASFETTAKLFDAIEDYLEMWDRGGGHPSAGSHSPPRDQCRTFTVCQLEVLAQNLLQELPRAFGRLPFHSLDQALAVLPKDSSSEALKLLRFMHGHFFRIADCAIDDLQGFQDGHQFRSRPGGLRGILGQPVQGGKDGRPHLIQHAILALATVNSELWQMEDAFEAVAESVRAAQEVSDSNTLAACLWVHSQLMLRVGKTGEAVSMLKTCLNRAEILGLPTLQSLSCLGMAHALLKPSLAGEHSQQQAPTASDQLGVRLQGSTPSTAAAPAGNFGQGQAPAGPPREHNPAFGFGTGAAAASPLNVGSSVLSGLIGKSLGVLPMSGQPGSQDSACREALSYLTTASHLSYQAGSQQDLQTKVLLGQAEVARHFGLTNLAQESCKALLSDGGQNLPAEDMALAACHLISLASMNSAAETRSAIRDLVQQLPFASHLWSPVVLPVLIESCVRSGDMENAQALFHEAAGAARAAVPHVVGPNPAQHRLQQAANKYRCASKDYLPVYKSCMEALEGKSGSPPAAGEACDHYLQLADVNLAAKQPLNALTPALNCLGVAEQAGLLHYRWEAVIRIAKVRLEIGDLAGAMSVTEEAEPELGPAGTNTLLRGQLWMIQAQVLLALLAKNQDKQDSRPRLLEASMRLLLKAVAAFEVMEDLHGWRRCEYLLARCYHEVDDIPSRDLHAEVFRRLSLAGPERPSPVVAPAGMPPCAAAFAAAVPRAATPTLDKLLAVAEASSEKSEKVSSLVELVLRVTSGPPGFTQSHSRPS